MRDENVRNESHVKCKGMRSDLELHALFLLGEMHYMAVRMSVRSEGEG